MKGFKRELAEMRSGQGPRINQQYIHSIVLSLWRSNNWDNQTISCARNRTRDRQLNEKQNRNIILLECVGMQFINVTMYVNNNQKQKQYIKLRCRGFRGCSSWGYSSMRMIKRGRENRRNDNSNNCNHKC